MGSLCALHNCMQDPDRFDYRRPQDYVYVLVGMIYTVCLPIIWLMRLTQWIGSVLDTVDSSPNRPRRASRSRVIRSKPSKSKPYRFKTPRRTPTKPYKAKPIKPIESISRRWVKSLGRYQTRYYNRLTGRTRVEPRVSDLVPKK